MPQRTNDSTLSGSNSRQDQPGISSETINPGIQENEVPAGMRGEANDASDENRSGGVESQGMQSDRRGSGTDANSNSGRLNDQENYLDKMAEDSFPASDPPSFSPITGVSETSAAGIVGGEDDEVDANSASSSGRDRDDVSGLPEDFKDNKAAQFEYGRESQRRTQHFDQTSRRLDHGNPDIGNVDLGNIEADRPAQPDDRDQFD